MIYRALPLLMLASCLDLSLPPLADGPLVVPVTVSSKLVVDAVMPSDLMVDGNGGYVILDGYAGAVHTVAAGASTSTLHRNEAFRGAVRGSPDGAGGYWLAAPNADEVRHVDAEGALVGAWEIPAPVAVAPLGQELVVGLRQGGVMWIPPGQQARKVLTQDVDGLDFGAIASIDTTMGDEVLVVDTLGHRVHVLGPSEPRDALGHYGMWIGALSKPKSAVMVAGGVYAVADSSLGVVQLFDRDGTALGALSDGAQPLRFEHAMDVAWTGSDLLILDAGTSTVHRVPLAGSDIVQARKGAQVRHLRYHLVDQETAARPAGEAKLCRQCHDGVVNDDRMVWDDALHNHPVGVVPDREVPAFFPRDEDGALRCGTCHSPHGVSSLADVRGVTDADQVTGLVRHKADAGDQFTRMSRQDSELCLGCHEDAAHEQVVERLGLAGSSHPVGQALDAALAKREAGPSVTDLPNGVAGACMTCHSPHGAATASLGRADGAAETCMACHPEQATPTSHPLVGALPAPKPGTELPVGEDGPTCLTCHALVDGRGPKLVRTAKDGQDLCVSCHEDGPAKGKHAMLGVGGKGACRTCHDPHADGGEHLLAAKVRGAKACATCHTQQAAAAQGHPSTPDVLCDACHGSAHAPAVDTTCGSCHEEQQRKADKGGHGGVDCVACHPAHTDSPKAAFAANPASKPCLACHGPGGAASTVQAWEHKARLFGEMSSRWEPAMGLGLFNKQGERVPAGKGGELACASCHTVHGPHDDAPSDSLRRPGWEEPCGACHGDEALMLYRWFHKPDRRPEATP